MYEIREVMVFGFVSWVLYRVLGQTGVLEMAQKLSFGEGVEQQ